MSNLMWAFVGCSVITIVWIEYMLAWERSR